MSGILSLLDIGRKGIFASQSAIQVTGNNITNVNTEGYHRRTLVLEESGSIDFRPGQLGTGVDAKEIVRSFDRFIENTYNDKSSDMSRWETLHTQLRGLDSLFNEANGEGMNKALSKFFSDWQDLTQRPDDVSSREALVSDTQNLISILTQADDHLTRVQEQMNAFIQQEVDDVNEITRSIARINRQIANQEIPGQNNTNELYDERDRLVRELAGKVDVKVIDNDGGNMTIVTRSGHTLVDGQEQFDLRFEAPKTSTELTASSNFDGEIYFEGNDDYEYYFEAVQAGGVASGAGGAQLKVSLDGGKTFLKDDDGKDLIVYARPDDEKVSVRGLTIWFGQSGNPLATPANNMEVGDRFVITPKKGLYWYQDTAQPENITPQMNLDGTDNNRRLTGGSLSGLFTFRDNYIGRYRDKLDSFTESLVWEVNRIHSQGAGLTKFSKAEGTYAASNDTVPVGDPASGLAFGNRLSAGNAMIYVYDKNTGALQEGKAIDFDPATPEVDNFDPTKHSLEDVRQAIDNTFGASLTVSIDDHRLSITAEDGKEFAFGSDTTGLFAALGLNTYFNGSDAGEISLNPDVGRDLNHLNAGHVNGAGEANSGDNTTALKLAGLGTEKVSIRTIHTGTQQTTLSGFYNSLVSEVGADTSNAEFTHKYQKALATDLDNRQKEISGVNLDEELSQLIKFQHSYTAAAKLISTADQMMQTLIGLKQ